MQVGEQRRPTRQDTFDLRDQITPDDHSHYAQDMTYPSDEEHSVLEDDSDGEEREEFIDDDDGSSSLSIPNESIDFDLVYALHSFAATVEGQANVVKGDSLFLMDDSNSYWWLVRVLKTQEVGYIPAENIETPFERLARLNKHRNVDLASATETELKESKEFIVARNGSNHATPSPTAAADPSRTGSRARSRQRRTVYFTPALSVHRYPPAVWGDDEEEDEDIEWDDEGYEDEDPDIADDMENDRKMRIAQGETDLPPGMEPDDGMSWEDGAVESIQAIAPQGKPDQVVSSSNSDTSMEAQQQEAMRRQQQRMQDEQQRTAATGVNVIQTSRERLTAGQDVPTSGSPTSPASASPTSPSRVMDPAAVTETRKVSITPTVARSADDQQPRLQGNNGPLLSSQEQDRKRTREEIEAEEVQRKKANKGAARPGSATDQRQSTGKLRKERDRGEVTTDEEGAKDKKKKSGVFGVLFNRKKDKVKDKDKGGGSESGSMNSIASSDMRGSEESGRPSSQQNITAEATSPVTASARQQQQQAMQQQAQKGPVDPRRTQQQQQQQPPPQRVIAQAQLSQHASQLRQRDQQQQALYQQYLNRSPSSPPEVQPSYGLQSAPAIMPGSTSFTSSTSSTSGLAPISRPRPGSLVLSPGTMDAQGVGLPDLSVVRVFAGDHLQTEATFKTVLLNASTTASELVRQAIQRFRLPAGEDPSDYFLTIKQVEGSSATLLSHEKPLGVFESLVEAAMELPKVKRSSVGSISSVASNLSMHPAIKKLSMNDFTDDSAVKFYLNRKGGEQDGSMTGDEGEDTILAESFADDDGTSPRSSVQYLSPISGSGSSVGLERFSSPSYRFALQVVIYPEDLPDDMVFDPLTEAIVFKDTLRDRPTSSISSPGISLTHRRKIFTFPKNANVAEVIEVGLERFGIIDGVVDGGDEVEDKTTKRRSSTRVRYGLSVDLTGRGEKELAPTSKVLEAFPRPPVFRATKAGDNKRRSVDSAQLLLGSIDDIGQDDPVFILRRAVTYRPSSRHRSSAPLDEVALQKLHRESMSGSSTMSESTVGAGDEPKRQQSKQEIIAAQRAARSANQRAVLSAQSNSARGLDVLLPGNVMIRSTRYDVDDRMRYSYVEPDGETYDISDIVEAEWRGEGGRERGSIRDDLLQGVISRDKDRLGAKLDRVLSKIKHDKTAGRVSQSASESAFDGIDAVRTTSPSLYSTAEGTTSRSATPNAVNGRSTTPTSGQRTTSPVSHMSSYRTASPGDSEPRSRSSTATPSGSHQRGVRIPHERQQSLVSVLSNSSAPYRSATPSTPATPKPTKHRVMVPKDDFGVAQMMAVIETRGMIRNKVSLPPLDPVDNLLFGREVDINSLHPKIREIYSDTFKQLEEMDHTLDDLLHHVAHAF